MHYRKIALISGTLGAALMALSCSANGTELDKYLELETTVSGTDDAYKAILGIVKDGYEITSASTATKIERNNAGGIFQSYINTLFVLKHKSSGEFVICSSYGWTEGGFDNSVNRAVTCYK